MKLKPLVIFLVIFTLGFGAGFLISGRLTKNSIEAVKKRETTLGFKEDLYQYLDPNTSQKHIIDSIVAEYIPKIKEERAISRLYQKHLRDSMFTQIQVLLDNNQKDKLKKFEQEKLVKKRENKVAKQKDTSKVNIAKSRKQQFENFKQTLTPEQKLTLDSILQKKPKRIKNPEMNKEIRQYTRTNIMPVLRKYRGVFENELSDDEKNTIAEIRTKRKDLIKSELLSLGDEESQNKQNALIAEAKKELGSILLNHKKELEEIAETLKPEREQWIKDIAKIKQKYYPDYSPAVDDEFRNKEKNAIDFLLMNGERRMGKGLKKRK